jgi:hypothetical protein
MSEERLPIRWGIDIQSNVKPKGSQSTGSPWRRIRGTGRNNFKEQGDKILTLNDEKAGSNLPPRAEQILRTA